LILKKNNTKGRARGLRAHAPSSIAGQSGGTVLHREKLDDGSCHRREGTATPEAGTRRGIITQKHHTEGGEELTQASLMGKKRLSRRISDRKRIKIFPEENGRRTRGGRRTTRKSRMKTREVSGTHKRGLHVISRTPPRKILQGIEKKRGGQTLVT